MRSPVPMEHSSYSYNAIQLLVVFCIFSTLPIFGSSVPPNVANNIFCQPPPNFPTTIPLTRQTFQNWANDLVVQDLWTVVPNSLNDLLTVVNWASANGYTIRASGQMHNWSPLTVTKTTSCTRTKVILVKTTSWLTDMEMISSDAVKVQSGVLLETLLTFLEKNGGGVLNTPAPGDLTIGGILAIGGHGTGIPVSGETEPPGFTHGTFSNLVVALTAIVWDPAKGQYVTREFHRSDPNTKAFLTNLGRTFLIDVTLRVGQNYNLRCESRVDIPASELFAFPGSNVHDQTIESFLTKSGRIETTWYAYTEKPWLKIWTVSPNKPKGSREVKTPYNYPFTDAYPPEFARLVGLLIEGAWFLAPEVGALEYGLTLAGLTTTASRDIWGPSKNLLLYLRPTTLKVTFNGHVVITRRSSVQNIIHSVYTFYSNKMSEYRSRGMYPVNGPLEMRITGLDVAGDVGIPGAESPSISPVTPLENRPDLNTAVWFNVQTVPKTPNTNEFMTELESYFLFTLNDGVNAVVRPEWSKGWSFTPDSPYSNATVFNHVLPSVYGPNNFQWTVNKLNEFDPRNIFTNDFLESFMK